MWPFRSKARPLTPDWAGPASFPDWTDREISLVSKAIRKNGQPESDGFKRFALVALNTLRGRSGVELVARAMEESANPGQDPDRPIDGNHYLRGLPHWCMWVEYARPAVEFITKQGIKKISGAGR